MRRFLPGGDRRHDLARCGVDDGYRPAALSRRDDPAVLQPDDAVRAFVRCEIDRLELCPRCDVEQVDGPAAISDDRGRLSVR